MPRRTLLPPMMSTTVTVMSSTKLMPDWDWMPHQSPRAMVLNRASPVAVPIGWPTVLQLLAVLFSALGLVGVAGPLEMIVSFAVLFVLLIVRPRGLPMKL